MAKLGMNYAQLLKHVIDHPDHHAVLVVSRLGFTELRRWHTQDHRIGAMTHDLEEF